ncbi:DUF4282 domain-containing protein [Spirillospora sp. CA-255316]
MSGPRRSKGVARGLLDLRFRTVVTPWLIGWLYAAAAGFMALGALAGVALIAGLASWLGAGWLIFAPVVIAAGAAGVLAVRVGCEWLLMSFTRGRGLTGETDKSGRAADGRWRQEGDRWR